MFKHKTMNIVNTVDHSDSLLTDTGFLKREGVSEGSGHQKANMATIWMYLNTAKYG